MDIKKELYENAKLGDVKSREALRRGYPSLFEQLRREETENFKIQTEMRAERKKQSEQQKIIDSARNRIYTDIRND